MELLEFVKEKAEEYYKRQGFLGQEVTNNNCHLFRYMKTLELLNFSRFEGKKVLEVGGFETISYIIREYFKENGNEYRNTSFELRNKWPLKDESFNYIVNTEVIEHINDRKIEYEITLSGVKHFLKECYRVLENNGIMLLSSPNACSYNNLNNLLNNKPPTLYRPHFREYTVEELQNLLIEAGFKIQYTFADFYGENLDPKGQQIINFLKKHNYYNIHRGQYIYIIVKKEEE